MTNKLEMAMRDPLYVRALSASMIASMNSRGGYRQGTNGFAGADVNN